MHGKIPRTAFEKDSTIEHTELILKVRDYIKICIDNDAKENHIHID